MAQITVPGSTAESTNVTPVSAEVPTGVTLPEQIGDFTAQTNAAEPSGPTVDAAQDLPIEQPEWNYFDDQYEIRRMAADALDCGDSQKAIRVAALAEHYNRSQLEVELNLDREEKRLQREQTETLLADLPTSSRYFQENPLEAPIFKNDLKPLALMEKQFGRLGSAQSWKPEIDPHTKPSGTFSREKPLRLGDDESTGDEELDERIQLVKRPGDYLSDTVGHLGDWYKVGTLQTEQGLLWNRARQGFTRIDEHLLSEDRRLESEMKTLTGDAEGNAIYEAAVVVGQMVSSMFSGSGIEGAAKGAAVGGMSASVIPGIGTVAGLVGGSALGAATQSTFDVEAGSSYRDMYMAKVDPAAARWLSTGAGAVNSLIEMVGIKVLGSAAKPLLGTLMTKYGAKTVNAALATPTMGTVLKHAALAYAGGVGEEVATEVMQEGVNMASEEIARLYANGNFGAVNGEALFDRLSEIAWKTLQATAVLGALGGGAAVGVGAHKVHRANQTKEFFETAAQAVPQMESIQTAPNKIQALIARQADAAGAPTTYIDGAEFRQAMIDQNVSMTDLRQIAPEVADQVEAAADLGVDVEVSTSEYATKFASTPLGQRLTDHVRLAPDALSVADLIKVDQARKDLMKQIVKASFDGNEQKLADRFLDSVENRQWRQESSRIEKMLAAQIHTVAPHFQKAEVLTQARLGASMVTLLAQRSGIPAERIGQIMPTILAKHTYVNQKKMRQWLRTDASLRLENVYDSGSNSLRGSQGVMGNTILTELDLVKAKEAFPGLYQESNAGQRGSFSPLTNTIALTPNADLSTFAHEMSHWYLANLIEFSKLDGVDISVTEDVETLLKEFGLKDVAQWDALGFEGQRKFHERFAYQAEVYLSTGHAPTRSLERFFARFASWIKSVYLQWSGDARAALSASYQAEFGEDLPDISPDMKRVFDRMLVAQRDLDLAESANGLKPLFDQKPEDMPEDQWRELMAARDEATARGEAKLFEAQAKDEKWYVNARLRSARRIDREAKDYRDRVEEKVRARINARKEFAAFDALKSGGKVFSIENLKIDPESLDGLGLKPAVVAKLQKLGLTKKSGFPITAARQLLQPIARFKTNEQLVAGLIAGSKDREKIIQDETSRICLENKSDYFDPIKKEELIEKAIHSEARGRMVATELKYLAGDKTMSARVIQEAARQVALERFEQMRAGKINPKTFMAAESRASREAYSKLVAGDRLGAAMAKRRQLLNYEFALMAIDFKRTMDHLSDLRKQIFKSDKELAKTRDIDVIAVARYILNASGFGRIHPKDMNANALEKTIEKFKNNDANKFEEYKAILAPYGYSPGRNYDWRTYAVADVRAILQQVNDFWKKAGDDRAVLLHGRRKNLTEVVDELVTHIDNGKDIFSAGAKSAVTPMEKLRFHYLGWKASMMRVESWCRIMDGGRAGIFSKYIYQPVENAVVRYKNENMEYQRRFGEILQSAEKEWGQSDAIEAPEINYTFNTKAELMGAILHTGNASNKRKLLLGGRGIDDNNVRHAWAAIKERDDGTQYVDTSAWDSFINRMYVQGRVTKADMDAVQAIWDLLEETKPKAQAAYMEMYGYRFEEVQATSVVTPFGTYRGGYVPAVTDRYLYQKRDAQMKQEELERSNFLTLMPVHKPGFSKTRVEDFTQPLQLNVAAYGMHIAKVLRFADIAPAVMQVDKIITNHRFQDAIAAHNPRLVSQMLKPFLTRAVGQTVSDGKIGWVDRTFNHLRGLAGMNVMFLNLINTFQQWTGFSIAASKVPASLIGRAFKEYGLAPKECAEFVKAASPFMRQRLDNFAYEYQSTIEEIGNQQVQKISQVQGLGNKAAAVWSKGAPVRDMVNRHGYILQTLAQYPIDVSVWKAAYEYNYSHGMSHEEAVQEADSVIRTTQSDFNPENVSAIEAGSALKRFFLVFYNYFNMQYNLLQERAAFRKATKQYGRFALDAILIVWIPSVVGKLITDALMGGSDDDDDALDALDIIQLTVGEPLKGTISMVPLAGQISAFAGAKMAQAGSVTAQAIWGKSPYVGRVGSAPAIMLMEGAISGASDIVRIINDDEKVNGRTAARNILDLTAVATGMPVGGLKRPIGYIAGVVSGDIDEPETALQAVRGLVGGK